MSVKDYDIVNSKIKDFNPALYADGAPTPDVTLGHMKAITWLLDKNEWAALKTSGNTTEIGNKVKYVVGAPSIEMLIDSYNTRYNLQGDSPVKTDVNRRDISPRLKLFYKFPYNSEVNGYSLGPGYSDDWDKQTGRYTIQSMSGEEYIRDMYTIDYGLIASPARQIYSSSGYIKESILQTSISAIGWNIRPLRIEYGGYFGPVVCLSTDTIIEF